MTFKPLLAICLLPAIVLCGCGGSSVGPTAATSALLTSNWQWTMDDPLQQGGLTGGFFQQTGNSISGSLAYAIYGGPAHLVCSGGSAPLTGTLNGQSVSFTAVAGGQTYSFTGTISTTGASPTMVGTYTSTDGTPIAGGGTCGTGTGQQPLNWSAISVAPLTGTFQGSFHSLGFVLAGQDFPVSGTLTQSENTGASFASLTGTLSVSGYTCLSQASLNGTISGSSVILSVIGANGLSIGSIGSASLGGLPPTPARLRLGQTGRILLGVSSSPVTGGYQVTTGPCPLQNGQDPGDFGNACLGLGPATDCGMPISFSPATLTFPAQVLGTSPTMQPIVLTNTDPSGQPQTLNLALNSGGAAINGLVGDFNGQPNFTEQDTCGRSPFTLAPNQSCTIYVSFSPQESCPWNPTLVPALQCPFNLNALISITTATSPVDGNSNFSLPITGTGLSAIASSTAELDFSAEDPTTGEQSQPQWITLTNQALYPVQILPSATCAFQPLPLPLVPGSASGLQVVSFQGFIGTPLAPFGQCDAPAPASEFPIGVDNCSGFTLQPQQVCTISIASKPQTNSLLGATTNYLELNTLQCVSPQQPGPTSPCEIDAGRFPITLNRQTHANSIRLIPAASLTFAAQSVGSTSAPQSITVFNDPNDSKPGVVSLQSIVVNGTDFAQTNSCGSTLSVGQSCTVTATFSPSTKGLRQGTIVITTPVTGTATIFLRGTGN